MVRALLLVVLMVVLGSHVSGPASSLAQSETDVQATTPSASTPSAPIPAAPTPATSTTPDTTGSPQSLAPWLSSPVAAVLGALVAWYVTSNQKKKELTFTVITEYLSRTERLGEVYGLLDDIAWLDKQNDAATLRTRQQNINLIINTGNWLNIVAEMYMHGTIDKRHIDDVVSIGDSIRNFRARALKIERNPVLTQIGDWKYLSKFPSRTGERGT
jgi:hypothetical protein